ncbi:MAG: rhomboid family intramembrane serine protease [Planctomycetota bacterium]|nr:rhomboid family intramembrane serine protease [Planctomycetota bacterium]
MEADEQASDALDAKKVPITILACGLAIAATGYWWKGGDVDRWFMDARFLYGEPWRPVSSSFLHANLLHIVFNLYWTWIFGTYIETRYGSARTLGLFLFLASAASLGEFLFLRGGVGLSGVGYGYFGFLWALRSRTPDVDKVLRKETVALFVGWFFLCIVLTYTGAMKVANFAHGFGCLAGLLAGAAAASQDARRAAFAGGTAAFAAALLGLTVFARGAFNLDPDIGLDLMRIGYQRFKQNDFEGAVRFYKEALSLNPNKTDWWINLGGCYAQQHRDEEAQAAFRKAWEIDPSSKDAQEAASYFSKRAAAKAFEAKRFAEAAGHYREALTYEAGNPDLWYWLGLNLQFESRWGEAADAYKEAVRLNPGKDEWWVSLGGAYAKAERRDEALAAYRKAYDLDPAKEQTRVGATYYLKIDAAKAWIEKRYEEAERLLREILAIEPDKAAFWNNLGGCLEQLKRPADAAAAYQKAADLEPGNAAFKASAERTRKEAGLPDPPPLPQAPQP